MFKIGEFSKLSLVSVRMLRHYGELGLLMPEETDVFTGYRYYSADRNAYELQCSGKGNIE